MKRAGVAGIALRARGANMYAEAEPATRRRAHGTVSNARERNGKTPQNAFERVWRGVFRGANQGCFGGGDTLPAGMVFRQG
ncbi:hypothetical protein LH22_05145 [Pantoea rwandensis]|uniref:Uncharacterized protein n=1 Tax=Pantoea rwandensis TaxID=1076550 RepID=A0ABM5RG94_9GAMM|nr:hypothetical protein LH22_05145 [Pantoea rwandensis]